MADIIGLLIFLFILLFSIVIHEVAHGWMADRCGDSTARHMGRLTMNPLVHIDPIGTVLIPFALILFSKISNSPLFLFGWAKPVPINPYNFNNPNTDVAKVGLAGPIANFTVAVLLALLYRVFPYIYPIAQLGIVLNLVLGTFNLIPIPPLDGSRVLVSLLPPHLAYKFSKLDRYGFIILIILLYSGGIDVILKLIIFPLTAILIPAPITSI